jgi:Cell division protein ZapA.
MPVLKTEILGIELEINYEKKDYDKLNDLIEKFKKRLSEFPNDGRASSSQILFLAALKTEDELETMKKQNDLEANKEIIFLKKELEKIKSPSVSSIQDNTSAIVEIKELQKVTKLIQDRIKESVK